MKLKRFNTINESEDKFLNEGTWAWEGPIEAKKLKKELEDFKDKAYNIVGDDQFFDGIDSAIARLDEMIKDNPTK